MVVIGGTSERSISPIDHSDEVPTTSASRKSLAHHLAQSAEVGFTSKDSDDDGAPSQRRSICGKLCGCLRRDQSKSFHQTLVVLRHSERKDRMDSTYHSSEEGLQWPHDCPITANGIDLAKDVAAEMLALNKKANFTMVACSPYRRCLETAAEVAKALNLPMVVDQELGEVFDQTMPKEPSPFRSPKQLREMCQLLGVRIMNPELDDGGVKLFGKPPPWPESLEDAKKRFNVRIETYLEQSEETEQNFILVTHADAVAAALEMFERGFADIRNMDFCARLVAQRTLRQHKHIQQDEHGVYAEKWVVEFKGISAQLCKPESNTGMNQYFEKMHIDNCDETKKRAAKRRDNRTHTDAVFDSTLHKLPNKQGVAATGMGATIAQLREEQEAEDEASHAPNGSRLPGVVVCDAGHAA